MAIVLILILAAGLLALVAAHSLRALRLGWSARRLSRAQVEEWNPVLAVAEWGGVLLECGPNDVVVCLLPTLAPEAIAALRESPLRKYNVAALVVSNQQEAGFLWTSEVQRALQIPASDVFATAPAAPVDRFPGSRPGTPMARPVPRELKRGTLSLRWDGAGRLLMATWSGTRVRAAVGSGLSLRTLPAGTTAVVGSLAASPDNRPMPDLQRAVLLASCPPDTWQTAEVELTRAGVDVTTVPRS